jgi:hypothetical protein
VTRPSEARGDVLEASDRHGGAEALRELAVAVGGGAGGNEARDLAAAFGDDECLAELYSIEVAAEILAEFSDADGGRHCASKGSTTADATARHATRNKCWKT